MLKKIQLKNQEIVYKHKIIARTRNLRITIHSDASLVVTSPYFFSQNKIENFLQAKADWILSKITDLQNRPKPLIAIGTYRDYQRHKKTAQALVINKIKIINTVHDFVFKRISIKNQKTRWGSCSKQGNLNFNYKIALLPERLAEYIIIHELCHLKEFNHSQRFWDLVGCIMPDYQLARRELRQKNLHYN